MLSDEELLSIEREIRHDAEVHGDDDDFGDDVRSGYYCNKTRQLLREAQRLRSVNASIAEQNMTLANKNVQLWVKNEILQERLDYECSSASDKFTSDPALQCDVAECNNVWRGIVHGWYLCGECLKSVDWEA